MFTEKEKYPVEDNNVVNDPAELRMLLIEFNKQIAYMRDNCLSYCKAVSNLRGEMKVSEKETLKETKCQGGYLKELELVLNQMQELNTTFKNLDLELIKITGGIE
jgi:hypothetical protein